MDISIFDVIGPVMIGPSSSHTAGAAKLSRIARIIVDKPFHRVRFGLHGSFAKTFKGHGTDKALLAGAMGLYEDDERLSNAFYLAKKAGLEYDFYEISLDGYHENTVKMTFYLDDGHITEIIGSSIGGGQILISKIGDFETEISARSSTIVVRHRDKKGVISEITKALAENDINIGIMKLSRIAKGKISCCVLETDSVIPDDVEIKLKKVENVIDVQVINISDGR